MSSFAICALAMVGCRSGANSANVSPPSNSSGRGAQEGTNASAAPGESANSVASTNAETAHLPYAPTRLAMERAHEPTCTRFPTFYTQDVPDRLAGGTEAPNGFTVPERAVGAVDCNGDARLDLVFANRRFLATGYRSFYAEPDTEIEWAPPVISAALGDIDGDGIHDALLAGGEGFSVPCLLLRFGDKQGLQRGDSCLGFGKAGLMTIDTRGRPFTGQTGAPLPCAVQDSRMWAQDTSHWRACALTVDIVDLDGDGQAEMAHLDRAGQQIVRSQMLPDKTMRTLEPVTLPSKPLWWLRAALNDGLERDHIIVTETEVLVLDRNRLQPRRLLAGSFVDVAVRDLTKDGVREVLAITSSGKLSVLRGRGNGQFEPHSSYLVRAGAPPVSGLFIADLDADLLLDVVVVSGYFAVAWGLGDAHLSAPILLEPPKRGLVLKPRVSDNSGNTYLDLDGDGQEERITQDIDRVVVQRGLGRDLFDPPEEVRVINPQREIRWHDVNDDRLQDLLTFDPESGSELAFLARRCPQH